MSYDPTQPGGEPSWQPDQSPGATPESGAYGQPGGEQQPSYGQPGGYQQPGYQQPGYQTYGQPGYQSYTQPGYGTPASPSLPTDPLALPAMITSIIGAVLAFLCCGLYGVATIPCVIGAVLGFMSRKRITESNGTVGGAGFALAALIVGPIGAVWSIIWLVLRLLAFTTFWY